MSLFRKRRGIVATQRAERRLAAILAADIAGYSRLIGLDEEGTLARLRTIRSTSIPCTYNSSRSNFLAR